MTRFGRVLLVIVAVAFGIRVAYVAVAKAGPCPVVLADGTKVGSSPSSCLKGDELFYNAEANSVAAGHGFEEPLSAFTHPGEKPPPAADHPPLTVFVLTPVSWLAEHAPFDAVIKETLHDHVREHRYTMVLLGTLLVALVGLLGRRIGGDAVGLVAAAIAAVSPNIWVNDGLVMSETLTALTVVGALLAAVWWRERPGVGRAAVVGAMCGLAILARVEFALLVPLLAVVYALTLHQPWSDRWKQAGVTVVVALVVIAPWVGFNLARFHDPTFVSTNDGLTLAGANCDAVYHGSSTGFWSLTCGANPPAGDQSQASSALRRRGIDYVKDHAFAVADGRARPAGPHVERVPPARHGAPQPGRGSRGLGHPARSRGVLPDDAVRDRGGDRAVAAAVARGAVGPARPVGHRHDQHGRHLRADAISRRAPSPRSRSWPRTVRSRWCSAAAG